MVTLPPSTQENDQPTRPELLKILCILTFIGSGLSLISNTIMFFSIDIIRSYYENGNFDFLAESMDLTALELLINVNSSYFLFQALIFALSVYGAYLMWNLKKIGFHIYTIAQIVLIILTQVFITELPFPFFELMISLIFITFYAKNLQYLN